MKQLTRSMALMALLIMSGCQGMPPAAGKHNATMPAGLRGPDEAWLWDALPSHLLDSKRALMRSTPAASAA